MILGAALAAVWYWVVSPHLGQIIQQQQSGRRRGFMNQAMPVGVADVQTGDLPIVLKGLGTVTPLATVTVKTQINGTLIQVAFTEGQMVKKGDLLAQIDPRIYQAQVEQFQGQLARDQAQLANAKLDLARYQKLNSQDSIARQTYDTQLATVQQDEGVVQIDRGQLDNAKVSLDYCRIVSPVDGQVGIRQVDEGNYVQTGDANGIVVITQLQPITVIFTLPEDSISQVVKQLRTGATLTATAFDRTDSTRLAQGTLATIDNQIDTSTGTLKLRATFANADEELFPNQFVNVHLLVNTLHNATLAPVAAVQTGTPGSYVYIVNDDNTVSVRTVQTGPTDGEHVAITSGLSPGEKVVVDGVDRLRDGATVTIPPPPTNQANAKGSLGQQGQHRHRGNWDHGQPGAPGNPGNAGHQLPGAAAGADQATAPGGQTQGADGQEHRHRHRPEGSPSGSPSSSSSSPTESTSQ